MGESKNEMTGHEKGKDRKRTEDIHMLLRTGMIEVSWKGSWLRLERDVWGFEFGNRTLR